VTRAHGADGGADFLAAPCARARDTLAFVASDQGEGVYGSLNRTRVSFYPVEPDQFFNGGTMAGFGRYVLLRILHPSARLRFELSLTATYIRTRGHVLPPVRVIGTGSVRLPLIGRGSARVFSTLVRPRRIGGGSYALLDLGAANGLQPEARPGLQGLWGRSKAVDVRYLAAYVRDVSVVTDRRYRSLRRPAALAGFPGALANPALEYSGVYEDGWLAEESYAVLTGGPAAQLELEAELPPAMSGARLTVLIDGRPVARRRVAPGELSIHVAIAASHEPRRVELRWSRAPRLSDVDARRASALLRSLRIVGP
jgi:hypothetical protein